MKKVLITGASSGLGAELATLYLQNHSVVYACGRNQDKLEQLKQYSGNSVSVTFDMSVKEQVFAALSDIDSLDVVILNAGDCLYIDDAKHFDSDIFAHIVNTNLVSVGYLLEALIKKINPGGQLVFISSSVTLLPLPRAEAYGASKAGMDYLANSLRLDLAKHDIDVSLIHPGFVKTPLTDKNNFDMPFLMDVEEAAKRTFRAIEKRQHYLQFPKRFTFLLRALSYIPIKLWIKITNRNNV
ncbi:SDR family NAD(P)-dependent oxidoreductase [Thalassotalea aquiviva]|uniref:SDR family NAD(P)-dependent oxidoreductase n=1 Tax=Thalassotalea aquiviva TaxID=3242415 RepID=UPI00352B4A8E